MLQPIDKRLVEKIQMLVGEGVRNVDERKRHLRHFVMNDLFDGQILPLVTNRRYHPKDVDIRNYIYKATVKHMLSKFHQENLGKKIENWKQENSQDSFFFRPCLVSSKEDFGDETSNDDGDVNIDVT